jgi:hypothetical protein
MDLSPGTDISPDKFPTGLERNDVTREFLADNFVSNLEAPEYGFARRFMGLTSLTYSSLVGIAC